MSERGMIPVAMLPEKSADPVLVDASSTFLHKLTYDVPMRVYGNTARLDQVVVTFRNEGRGWLLSVVTRGWPISSYYRKRRVDIFAGRHLQSDVAQLCVQRALMSVGLMEEDILNPEDDGRLWRESDREEVT